MDRNIYKSSSGRNLVEEQYKNILMAYTKYPFEQIYVQSKVGMTHILRFGDTAKPALILIHGSTSNSATWLGCISEFINDFCIYCIDIPGETGLSEPVRCTLNSNEPFEWLDSVLDSLRIERAFFLTMSLGSWYMLNFATRRPEKIIASSIITTSGIVPAKTSFIFKAILFMMMGKVGEKLLNKAVYHKTEIPDKVLEFQSVVAKNFNPVMERIPIFSDEQLKQITAPIQFFGGDHDALIDSKKTAERIAKLLPNSNINILEDRGHVIIDKFHDVKIFLTQYI